jgi:ABC-type lipoprotein export system ATPase subunit
MSRRRARRGWTPSGSRCPRSPWRRAEGLGCSGPPAAGFRFSPRGEPLDVMAAWRSGSECLDTWRARHVGYVLQTGALLPFLSIEENIALPLEIAGAPDRERVAALAARLGIADQLGKKPAALSVGQRQRAAVARALVHAPALILADEPTASVDPVMAEEVMDLLLAEAANAHAALVVATHDHAAIARLRLPIMRFEIGRGRIARTVARVVAA